MDSLDGSMQKLNMTIFPLMKKMLLITAYQRYKINSDLLNQRGV